MQEGLNCLVLGGINLELHHVFAPHNSIKHVGEEYVEVLQYVIHGNIWNVEQRLAVDHAHVLCQHAQ